MYTMNVYVIMKNHNRRFVEEIYDEKVAVMRQVFHVTYVNQPILGEKLAISIGSEDEAILDKTAEKIISIFKKHYIKCEVEDVWRKFGQRE